MKILSSLVFLLFLLSLSLSCSGEISQYVPAVIGNNGGLVNISLALVPGDGNIYMNIHPRIGVMTQESVETAVFYTQTLVERDNCNVILTFSVAPSTEVIDGPSAGTALSVMTYALFENRTIRNDTIITGAMDHQGNVLPVGGLYEKGKSALARGADYFITPQQTLYELILLKRLEEEYNITILEATTVKEVIGFMVENRSIEQKGIEAKHREIPQLPQYDSYELVDFRPLAERMMMLQARELETIESSDNEIREIKDFFRNEEKRQKQILDKGYLFSCANEAFLNFIEISTIKILLENDVDLPRKRGDVGKCLTSISRPVVSKRNFQWVVGADLRSAWAYDKLENTKPENVLLKEDEYVAYNELMFAEAWCNVAKGLLTAAPSGGEALDETVWKPIAERKLSEAYEYGITEPASFSRLRIAEESYLKGYYGAAIYDATYVLAMEKSTKDIESGIIIDEEEMLDENRSSLWGRIYHSHAVFLYNMNNTLYAYKTMMFAKDLDEVTSEMYVEKQEYEYREHEYDLTVIYGTMLVISIFLFILVVLIIGKAYGNERTRANKANRTKKKKGRT